MRAHFIIDRMLRVDEWTMGERRSEYTQSIQSTRIFIGKSGGTGFHMQSEYIFNVC